MRKTVSQQIVDSKNYCSIYGKFSSKKQIKVQLNQLVLDPYNQNDVLVSSKEEKKGESPRVQKVSEIFRLPS